MADQQQLPPGKEWKGSHTVAKDSRWLCAEDLLARGTREVVVEIEKVLRRDNLTMQEGRKMKVALSLKFRGKQKELLLNATNRKTLAALFGGGATDCGPWWGQRIALFVMDNVRMPDGSRGPALRIRAKRIPPGGAPLSAEPQEPAESQEERDSLLDTLAAAQLAADMDDAALWARAGVDSQEDFAALPVERLRGLLQELG